MYVKKCLLVHRSYITQKRKYPTIHGNVQGMSALVLYVVQSDTGLPETRVQVGGTKQDYSVSQVTSKITCINFSEHLLINSKYQFCTSTTLRSGVWWWLPDEYIAWACLHSGQGVRKRGRAGQRGFNYSREVMVK